MLLTKEYDKKLNRRQKVSILIFTGVLICNWICYILSKIFSSLSKRIKFMK